MTLAYVLVGVCIIGSAIAGCKEDLQKDRDYTKCLMAFTTYIQENSADPSAFMTVLCGKTAKSKLACLMGYGQTCPDIFESDDGGLLSQLKTLDTMCAMMSGGTDMGGDTDMGGSNGNTHAGINDESVTENPCTQVIQCLHVDKSSSGPQKQRQPDKTPFSSIQESLASVCGPMKDRMDCLASFEDQCPGEVDTIKKQSMSASPQGNQPGFDTVLKFMSEECPKIPKTFSTNKCVRDKLESTEFEQCYSKVAQMYSKSEEEMRSCPAYLAGKKCIEENVGKCGATEASVVVKASHLMMVGLPSNCEESSASSVHASLATLLTMVALCLGYVKF